MVGVSQTPGKSDGDAIIATFNSPSSIAVFNSSFFPQNRTSYSKVIYSKNTTECIYSDFNNYTKCIQEELESIDDNSSIDPKQIKILKMDSNFTVNSFDTQVIELLEIYLFANFVSI